jgi:hypothetical protein
MGCITKKQLNYEKIGFNFQIDPSLKAFSTFCFFAFCKQLLLLIANIKGPFWLSYLWVDHTEKNLGFKQIDSVECQYQNVVYAISSREHILSFLSTGPVDHKIDLSPVR